MMMVSLATKRGGLILEVLQTANLPLQQYEHGNGSPKLQIFLMLQPSEKQCDGEL
jgi:hypothetical protein